MRRAYYFSIIIILAMLGRGGAYGAEFTVTSPAPNAVIHGTTFSLQWTGDPDKVGWVQVTANGIDMGGFANAATNSVVLKVPPVRANTTIKIKFSYVWHSYWELASVPVSFADSVMPLQVAPPEINGDDMKIVIDGHPELAGSVLNVELWQLNAIKVADLAAIYNYTAGHYELHVPRPHTAVGLNSYNIRVSSVWLSSHYLNPFSYNFPGFSLYYAYSDPFTLPSDPYVQVLAPNGGEAWATGSTHHILWHWDPLYMGTAARIELWGGDANKSSHYLMTLGYKWDCTADNDYELELPPVEPSTLNANFYQVRVVSIWQELHPAPQVPKDDFSDAKFTLAGTQPLGEVLYPVAPDPTTTAPLPVQWLPNANGTFTLMYTSRPELMGTAVRIDLYQGDTFICLLGNNWFNTTTNTLTLPDPQVPPGQTYNLRLTSYWLEQHPAPLVPTTIYSHEFIMATNPKFFVTHAEINKGSDSLQRLHVAWHADLAQYGTAYRVELAPVSNLYDRIPVGYEYNASGDTDDTFTLPTQVNFYYANVETDYKVLVTSYWREQNNLTNKTAVSSETLRVRLRQP